MLEIVQAVRIKSLMLNMMRLLQLVTQIQARIQFW